MAHIQERPKKRGLSSWQIQIRRPDHPTIIKTFPTKYEAEKFGEAMEAEFANCPKVRPPQTDEFILAKLKDEKLVDVIASFMKSDAVKQRHRNLAPTVVGNIGNVKVGEIRRSWVKAYIARMKTKDSRFGRPYCMETIIAHLQLINMIVRWRADDLDISHPGIPFSTKQLNEPWKNKRERRLEKGEEALLMKRLRRIEHKNKYQWRLLVRLAMETGARMQEMVKSDWKEFDLDLGMWTIPAHKTKTKTSRLVPLSKKAVRIMRLLWLMAAPNDTRPFHLLGIKSNCISTCFHRYAKQAGLVNFRFHDLRHEAISRMAVYKRKYTLFELMKIVGHTRTEMFSRYANLRGDELAGRMD
jgi:integrase